MFDMTCLLLLWRRELQIASNANLIILIIVMVMVTQHFVSNQSLVHNNNIPESATAAAF